MSKSAYLLAVRPECDTWTTPQWLFDELNAEFAFTIDVCALEDSAKCDRYFTPEDNGLLQEWTGRVWCNPPYSEIDPWMMKGQQSIDDGTAELVVFLVPSRTGVGWFHDYALKHEIRYLRGRLKFGDGKAGAPFDSCIVVMRRSVA